MYDEDNGELFAGARSRNIWVRGLLMLLFLAVLWFIRLIVLILAAFQFVFAIVTGGPNRRLLPFSRSVATYIQQMAAFVTWTTETRPFPFSPWPADGVISTDDPIADEPMAETPPAPSQDWDEAFEPDVAYEAPPPDPMADEPPPEPDADVASAEPVTDVSPPPPKPNSRSGGKGKKKKKKN